MRVDPEQLLILSVHSTFKMIFAINNKGTFFRVNSNRVEAGWLLISKIVPDLLHIPMQV